MWNLSYFSNRYQSDTYYCLDHKPYAGENQTLISRKQDFKILCPGENCSKEYSLNDIRDFISSCSSCKTADVMSIDEEIEHHQNEIERFKNEIEHAQNEMKRLEELKSTQKDKENEEGLLNKIETEREENEEEISAHQAEIERLQEKISCIEEVINKQDKDIEESQSRIDSLEARSEELTREPIGSVNNS